MHRFISGNTHINGTNKHREAFGVMDLTEERAVTLGQYIAENGATVRAAAQRFGVSKSTVHKDVSQRLRRLNPPLYESVRAILDRNKSERHIRGGMATKRKYEQQGKQQPLC